eukprot:2060090-Amphidinium_carterae.1
MSYPFGLTTFAIPILRFLYHTVLAGASDVEGEDPPLLTKEPEGTRTSLTGCIAKQQPLEEESFPQSVQGCARNSTR